MTEEEVNKELLKFFKRKRDKNRNIKFFVKYDLKGFDDLDLGDLNINEKPKNKKEIKIRVHKK